MLPKRLIRRVNISAIFNAILMFLLIITLYYVSLMSQPSSPARLEKRLVELKKQNDDLHRDNMILNNLRLDLFHRKFSFEDNMYVPLAQNNLSWVSYENKLLSHLENSIDVMWTFVSKKLKLVKSKKRYLYDWAQVMYGLVEQLTKQHCKYRQIKQVELRNMIHSTIDRLQSVEQCESSKKVVCSSLTCGFGCTMHHLVYCLIAALALNRTLVFNNSPNRFLQTLRSIDPGCKTVTPNKAISINKLKPDQFDQEDNIYLPVITTLNEEISFRPMAIPSQLHLRLEELSQVPFVLFVGIILDYVMTPSTLLNKRFESMKKALYDQKSDILIGIHVASYHSLQEYMDKVKMLFHRVKLQDKWKGIERNTKIYLSTDDLKVWQEEVPRFEDQGFHFVGNLNLTRRTVPIQEIILDVSMLSLSDYLVCAFSSQICRLAYELMQARSPLGQDMSFRGYSIDDPYYFEGQILHRFRAIASNQVEDDEDEEHSFVVGDQLGMIKEPHNGFLLGDLTQGRFFNNDHKLRHYPKFKVVEHVTSVFFKAFDEK